MKDLLEGVIFLLFRTEQIQKILSPEGIDASFYTTL
jgi:hypothetical protein